MGCAYTSLIKEKAQRAIKVIWSLIRPGKVHYHLKVRSRTVDGGEIISEVEAQIQCIH